MTYLRYSTLRTSIRLTVRVVPILIAASSWATAQQARVENPFFQPDRFFKDLFGEESEAERAAIQKIEISSREENQLGQAALKALRRQFQQHGISIESQGDDVAYLSELVRQLQPLMRNDNRYRRIAVLLADTPDTDARSFPGGTLVIFRGLIDFCETEAALVGILGHELSHIDRGHQLYHMRRWKMAQQSFRSKSFNPAKMMNLGQNIAKTFMRPFRPEEETEADLDGARWASQLGYDPTEMAKVFLRLHQRDGAKAVPISFLRSHPFHQDRYTAILKQAELLMRRHPNRTWYVGSQNLQRRVTRKQQEFDE